MTVRVSGMTQPSARTRPSASVAQAMSPIPGPGEAAIRVDQDSKEWLRRLRSSERERDLAIGELHVLLFRAASFEINRRRATLTDQRGGDAADLAHQSADDALMAILAKLDEFRGESRFTTWAYKFALYEAAAKVRKRAWQGREIPLTDGEWPALADAAAGPQADLEMTDLLARLRDAIGRELTPHQREVLVALALNDVPIDVLAERLNTTRGALYKTLHDARKKLRASFASQGISLGATDARKST
jgi:RNA polymerase sigma-70 factor, ECF subfamily